MEDKMIKVLVESGYSQIEAKETAKTLCGFVHEDLRAAVKKYVNSGGDELLEIIEGKYSVFELMKNHSFEYPAALIFIDWYRDAPKEADDALQWMK